MLSTILRLMVSSANSACVQCVIGRSDSAGDSQARAMIWHICSGVNVGGTPLRGASSSISLMRISSALSSRSLSISPSWSAATCVVSGRDFPYRPQCTDCSDLHRPSGRLCYGSPDIVHFWNDVQFVPVCYVDVLSIESFWALGLLVVALGLFSFIFWLPWLKPSARSYYYIPVTVLCLVVLVSCQACKSSATLQA